MCSERVTLCLSVISLFTVSCKQTSSAVIPVFSAVQGGKVELPCDLNSTSIEEDISLILWYRGESGSSIYSIDARETSLYDATHFPSKEYRARTYYNSSSSPSFLKITYLRKEDEGEYRCRVEYRRARTETQDVLLKVIVPPREAIIMDEFGQHLHGIIGPYNEGFPMSLICEGEGGDPPPEVTWWRDSTLIDATYTLTPQHFTRNELHFPTVRRSDLMTVLTCQATNSNFTTPVTSSVTLDLNLRPLDVRIHTVRHPVSIGQEVQLECQSQGARPPAQLTWWKDSEKLTQVRETVVREDNLTISVLTYVPAVNDNGRNLSCRADNPQLRDSEIEDIWTLNVYYPPQVTLSKNLWNDIEAVTEGSDVTLVCYIQANPPITDVSWRFNGKTLFSSPSQGIMIKNTTVILVPVRKEHQGYYQCQAYNTEGIGTSEDLFLRVYYSPKCTSIPRHIYRLTPSETLTVTCEVDADPTDVSFKWVLNKTSDNGQLQQINTFKSNGTRSIAKIPPETEFRYGILLCMASNRAGKQKEPCEFKIMPAGMPDSPKHCLITNRTSECIVVQCEAGSDGGLTQTFQMEMFNTETDFLQANISVSEVPVFTVCSLPIQSSYILVIYSSNAKGRSKSVALQSSTLPLQNAADEEQLQINHLRLVGVLIGSLSVVLLITFASIMLAKLRARKRRNAGRNFNGEMEKSQTQLMKECKETRRTGNQGPDIIPEKNYIQERSDATTRESIADEDTNPKRTKGEPPPNTYEKFQTIQYGEETKTPGKLRMIQENEGEVEECSITVETPLINDVQLNIRHWGDAYKEVGVLSTPV